MHASLAHAYSGLPLVVLAVLVCSLSCGGERQSSPQLPSYPSSYSITDSQRQAFSDGVITFEEYEAAFLRHVDCVNSAGIEWQPVLDSAGKFYDNEIRLRGPDPEAQGRIVDNCFAENVGATFDLWNWQNQPTAARLNQAREALATCLRSAGINVPEAPSEADFAGLRNERPAGFIECAENVSDEFGIPNFAG